MCGYFCIEFINYMLKGKTLLDYTKLKEYLRMNNLNVIELTNVNNEIKERKDIIKKLNKYVVSLII